MLHVHSNHAENAWLSRRTNVPTVSILSGRAGQANQTTMTEILILQFYPNCHLGVIGETFEAAGVQATTLRPDQGEALPPSDAAFDGVVMLGGAQYAEDDGNHPYLADAAIFSRAVHEHGKPQLGVCLGSQVLARALGARVHKQGWTELGFTELSLTDAALADPVLGGLAPQQKLLEYHEDTFDLPPGAELLMTGKACPNQAFRVGASYGFQCHFEASTKLWGEWYPGVKGDLEQNHPHYLDRWQDDFAAHEAGSRAFCNTVAAHWLQLVEQRNRNAA
jgi:GMP synthase (glutamine-hydrolysing)